MSLYFALMLGSFFGPFFLSFDKKIQFYTYYKFLVPAILIVAIPFIIWDEIFTVWGLWGFNAEHLNGFFIGSLPIEEICFFFVVPYACVFIYEVLQGYFPLLNSEKFARYFSIVFLFLALSLAIFYSDRMYTLVACSMAAILTIFVHFVYRLKWFSRFIITFIVVQVPFFFVNGVLTGMSTENPIVWYNPSEMINVRIVTIPVEDIFYNYAMLILVFVVYNLRKKRKGLAV